METVDKTTYRYICTTVSPYNIASIKDKLELGLSIRALNVKYETLTRYIMMKDLMQETIIEKEGVVVSMGATEEQQRLLNAGYIGTDIHLSDGDWHVTFQKMIQ